MNKNPPTETPGSDISQDERCLLENAWEWIRRNSGFVLLVLGLVVLYAGWRGFLIQFAHEQNDGTIYDAFYRSIQLFSIRSGSEFFNPVPEIEFARFAAVILIAFSTLYFFYRIFNEQIRLFLLRTRLFFSPLSRRLFPSGDTHPGHVVICGVGFIGSVMACHFQKEGRVVIILEKNKDNPELTKCRENGALVLHQDANNPDVLKSVGMKDAAMVFILTGDDSQNTDIASFCAAIARTRQRHLPPLVCHVHIDDPNLSFALRQWELELPDHDRIHFGFFNLYHASGGSAATCESRKMLKASIESAVQPVLLIIGLGDFGKSLLVNLGKRWHEIRKDSTAKMRIIVVDIQAKARVRSLCTIYPSLKDCCDIVPQQIDVHTAEFIKGEFLEGTDPRQLTGAYICLRDEGDATSVAITLHDLLCYKCGWSIVGSTTSRIIVRTVNDYGMTEVIRKLREGLGWNIHAFPIMTNFCEKKRYGNELSELLAEATHQDYLDREFGKGITEKENPSAVPWSKLSEDLRDLNRDQAESLIRNIHEYGYRIVPMRLWNEPFMKFDPADPMILDLAKREHVRYVEMKEAQGFRWGVKSDKLNKINETLVPWEDSRLKEKEKEKDIQTILGLPDRLARVYFKIQHHPVPRRVTDNNYAISASDKS
jgi:hypothetical protein